MPKIYAIVVAVLAVWLGFWIFLGWGAVQDDSFIHLRYADNLAEHHFITYDGTHPNYGASSLLFVSILAVLRGVTASPEMGHAVSTFFHLALFAGLAWGLLRLAANTPQPAKGLGLIFLALLCTPSAVRWLDDGMETSLTVALVCLLGWRLHKRAGIAGNLSRFDPALAALSFLAVLLRIELLQLCLFGTLILAAEEWPSSGGEAEQGQVRRNLAAKILRVSPLALGGALALGVILATMHTALPDTALAKMHGAAHWRNVLGDTAVTLAGALTFGAGMAMFWLLTLLLAGLRFGSLRAPTLLANLVFPFLLTVSVLRGQEIQGVRYFGWTFAFSSLWNILELSCAPANERAAARHIGQAFVYAFAVLLAVVLPVEAVTMHRVLTGRAATLRSFEAQRLEVLRGGRGVASDIGYIGFFTRATLCDLAGLANGREAARLTSAQRAEACAATDPDFLFVNLSQLGTMARFGDFSQWRVCGSYDFTNVRTPDSHYLIVKPARADEVCQATGYLQRSPGDMEAATSAMALLTARNGGG